MNEEVDTEITRQVWSGRVPLTIRLADADGGSDDEALNVLALRCAYLPLYMSLIRAHFAAIRSRSEAELAAEWWFSWRGIPLKWHYPIGLLHDMFTHSSLPSSAASKQDPTNPWRITLHFSAFPADKIFRSLPTPIHANDPPRDFYMNSLKESDFIRNMSVKKTMSLSKPDQTLLWDTLAESAGASTDSDLERSHAKLVELHDTFWGVDAKLMAGNVAAAAVENDETSVGTGGLAGGNHLCRSVAVRCYSGWDKPLFQELISPKNSSGADVTLLEALRILAPDLIPATSTSSAAHDMEGTNEDGSLLEQVKLISHGVEIPLDTPIAWLARHFSYPDNFLHLVLCTS
ncbi:autophagy protein Apg5-domain-containing protein [Chytriomyces cf. hyalinus JEL632]|nr:autophagy protein Apg5-domain-containing protein [Chytriomyces cf. hyalinus JEL632]